MEKIAKVLFIIILSISSLTARAAGNDDSSSAMSFWKPVIDAIIEVESEGDDNARSGASVGAMQITPILVAECNNILKQRKIKKRYTLADRRNRKKSIEMFLLVQSWFNPKRDVELAIRSWNGGMHYSTKRTQRYFEKVMSKIRNN